MQTYYACLIFSVCTLSLWSLEYTLDYKQLFPCFWNEIFHPIDIDQGGLLSLKLFALSFSAPTVHPTHTQSLPNGPTCGLGSVSSFSCYIFMLLLRNCPIPSPWGLLKPLLHSWIALQPLLLNYQTRPALGCVRHYQAFPLFSHLHFSTLLEVPWAKHMQYDHPSPQSHSCTLHHCKCPGTGSCMGKCLHSAVTIFRSRQRPVWHSQCKDPSAQVWSESTHQQTEHSKPKSCYGPSKASSIKFTWCCTTSPWVIQDLHRPWNICTMVPGVRNSKSGGHVFACGKMKIPPLLQGQPVSMPCCLEW